MTARPCHLCECTFDANNIVEIDGAWWCERCKNIHFVSKPKNVLTRESSPIRSRLTLSGILLIFVTSLVFLSHGYVQNYTIQTLALMQIIAERNLFDTALRIQYFLDATHDYPLSLERLANWTEGRWQIASVTTIADPYHGNRPLRFSHSGSHVTLYSVGPDSDDNHGEPFDPTTGHGDLVMQLSRRQ